MEASFKIVVDAFITWRNANIHNSKIDSRSEWIDSLPLYTTYTKKLSAYATLFDMTYEDAQHKVWDAAESISPVFDQPYSTKFTGAIRT